MGLSKRGSELSAFSLFCFADAAINYLGNYPSNVIANTQKRIALYWQLVKGSPSGNTDSLDAP
jgi:hypothetical protein